MKRYENSCLIICDMHLHLLCFHCFFKSTNISFEPERAQYSVKAKPHGSLMVLPGNMKKRFTPLNREKGGSD